MAKKENAAEPKYIDVTHGPYAWSQLQVSPEDFDLAIAENWGRDPFAKPDPAAPELTIEQHRAAHQAAAKAARRWRGEPEPEGGGNEPGEPPTGGEPPVGGEPEPEPPHPEHPDEIDEEEDGAARRGRASEAERPGSGASYSTRQSKKK